MGLLRRSLRLCYNPACLPLTLAGMLQHFMYRLIATLYLAFICITSVFFYTLALTIWLATRLFDRRLRLLHRYTCYWASFYIWVMHPWSVVVHGKENIDPDKTYVIVSNHQSLVDILVAFTLVTHFKWVAKAELFNIPLIGWNMSLNRYVKLRRGDRTSTDKMYRACEKHLKEGSSVYLFPEGTRSDSGKMRKFKEGAFVLARRLDMPILPLVISGSRMAVPKNSLSFHGKTQIDITVLPPMGPETFGNASARELADVAHELIETKLMSAPQPCGKLLQDHI